MVNSGNLIYPQPVALAHILLDTIGQGGVLIALNLLMCVAFLSLCSQESDSSL